MQLDTPKSVPFAASAKQSGKPKYFICHSKKIPHHAYWLCKKDQLRAEKLQYFSGQKITNCISFSSSKSSVKNLNVSHDCLFFFFSPVMTAFLKPLFTPYLQQGIGSTLVTHPPQTPSKTLSPPGTGYNPPDRCTSPAPELKCDPGVN